MELGGSLRHLRSSFKRRVNDKHMNAIDVVFIPHNLQLLVSLPRRLSGEDIEFYMLCFTDSFPVHDELNLATNPLLMVRESWRMHIASQSGA